ncbi:glycosyltransferase family 2 protein [Desulfoferrobacter suflitae]|uniref:glycosyltransferase family 2 protein n=1 Tax=Desulfoferrobacter suflitae TaxID=2865782 RepID=UPI0021642B2A|nr:glycosyltransferase family 2 protein [Desulfoferrobacter suflitae]MCK8600206.1 glycosyltransferase [Desulfoferrobacter suflitae]
MTNPLVSVIIPCYNQARFLPEAVESIQDQTYQNWECLIVNDGSTDDTAEVAAGLAAADRRVRHLNQFNAGLSSARNRGLKESRGWLIQFLDADDRLEALKLETHTSWLENHREIGIVYGEARYFTNENPELREFGLLGPNRPWQADEPWIGKLWACAMPLLQTVIEQNIMAVNCALICREVFESVGGWNESLGALEDWEFWTRCLFRGIRFQYLDAEDSKALVRSHSASMSRDFYRIHHATVQFRTIIGHFLLDSESRLKNYRYARCSLQMLPLGKRLRATLPLLSASWCPAVCREFMGEMILHLPLVREITRTIRYLVSHTEPCE